MALHPEFQTPRPPSPIHLPTHPHPDPSIYPPSPTNRIHNHTPFCRWSGETLQQQQAQRDRELRMQRARGHRRDLPSSASSASTDDCSRRGYSGINKGDVAGGSNSGKRKRGKNSSGSSSSSSHSNSQGSGRGGRNGLSRKAARRYAELRRSWEERLGIPTSSM